MVELSSTKEKARYLPPPPPMILCCKLEICQCNSDERCANYKNDENNKKHTIYCIYVVTPHSSKYIVEFYLYIDGTKRKESCHCHLRYGASIPCQFRNFSWVLVGTAWSLEFNFAVFTSNPTQYEQRGSNQCPYK